MTKETENQNHRDEYFEGQLDDEEVLYVFRKHPVVMRKGLVAASLITLIGPVFTFVLAFLNPDSPPSLGFFYLSLLFSVVLAGLVFLPHWISWYFSVFIVTDKRFIQVARKGLFKHKVGDLKLNQIQTMNYEVNGFVETVMGFGTIVLQTYIGDLVINPVPKPAKVQQRIAAILQDQGVELADLPDKED